MRHLQARRWGLGRLGDWLGPQCKVVQAWPGVRCVPVLASPHSLGGHRPLNAGEWGI